MSFSIVVTVLTVIFVVSIVALAGQFLYVFWYRRSFRRQTSPPPPRIQTPDFSTADVPTKELLYFFCLKTDTRVDPSGAPPDKNTERSTPDEEVVDVFKFLEANGPSRFLCTIKEEEKEDVESKPDVDPTTINNACLQSDLQFAGEATVVEEEEIAVTFDVADGNTKTEFSTPCDSPLYYTPAASPSRDFMVVSVDGT